jgi:hypothetical protein
MASILAFFKSLAALTGFVRWAVETVGKLVAESKKQHAEVTHHENKDAIDSAFDVQPAPDSVPDGAGSESRSETLSPPAVSSGKGGGT